MKDTILVLGIILVPMAIVTASYIMGFYPAYIVAALAIVSLAVLGRMVYVEQDLDSQVELSLATAMVALAYGAIWLSVI